MAAASHPLTSKPVSQNPLVRSLQSLSLKGSYEKSLIPFFKAISNQVPKAKQLLDRISKSSEDLQAQKITQWFDENGAMLSLVTQKPAINFKEYPCSHAAKLIKLRFIDFKHIWTEGLKARSLSFAKAMSTHPMYSKLEGHEIVKVLELMLDEDDLDEIDFFVKDPRIGQKDLHKIAQRALVQKRASFFEYIKGEGIFDLSSFFYNEYKEALFRADFNGIHDLLVLGGTESLSGKDFPMLLSLATFHQQDKLVLLIVKTLGPKVEEGLRSTLLAHYFGKKMVEHSETSLLVLEILIAKAKESGISLKPYVYHVFEHLPHNEEERAKFEHLCDLLMAEKPFLFDAAAKTYLLTHLILQENLYAFSSIKAKGWIDPSLFLILIEQKEIKLKLEDLTSPEFSHELQTYVATFAQEHFKQVIPLLLLLSREPAKMFSHIQKQCFKREQEWIESLLQHPDLVAYFSKRMESLSVDNKEDQWFLSLVLEAFSTRHESKPFLQLLEMAWVSKNKRLLEYCLHARAIKHVDDDYLLELVRKYPELRKELDRTGRTHSFTMKRSGK